MLEFILQMIISISYLKPFNCLQQKTIDFGVI